jgi:SAM-dependent methyltransferase
MGPEPDWSTYLESFHTQRPGITEDILARCTDTSGSTPYSWLVGGIDPAARVLDLACGSAPTRPLLGPRWVGLDRSQAELARAIELGRTTVVRGDVSRLPIASCSVEVVVCSMALMLVQPLSMVLIEIHRVLVPGGELRALLPATSPLTMGDRLAYLRLALTTRSVPRFPPSPLRRGNIDAFLGAELRVTAEDRHRFAYPLRTGRDCQLFIDSWYTPNRALADSASPWPAVHGLSTTIGVPLRRLRAVRREPDGRCSPQRSTQAS